MRSLSLDPPTGESQLGNLITTSINPFLLRSAIFNLQLRFEIYSATCPAPFIAHGVIVTHEIRNQSELYLPVAEVSTVFNRLYRSALTYPPIFSSSPFHNAMSWADVFAALPHRFQFSANPARLLEALLADHDLLTEFLFASFLPRRFYGGFGRYLGQMEFIRNWLCKREQQKVRCLDAACGTGEDSYGLAKLLLENGTSPKDVQIEGWTLEPLEVWAATHRSFPDDKKREANFRSETERLFENGYQASIRFRSVDLAKTSALEHNLPAMEATYNARFDLILCNGILGGPIIHNREKLEKIIANLASFLAPNGILLAADNFHGGWKSKFRNLDIGTMFAEMGMEILAVDEGAGGQKK